MNPKCSKSRFPSVSSRAGGTEAGFLQPHTAESPLSIQDEWGPSGPITF
jgi:hypothetical protein